MKKDAVIDGDPVELDYRQGDSLMDALRRNEYYSVKHGCDEGVCGACNVLLGDDRLVQSCTLPMEQYDGDNITTAAGLTGEDGSLHPVQEAFLDHGAVQCGFCIPGMVVSGVKLLRDNDDPSRQEIRQALDGNLCRCTGYVQNVEAIAAAADVVRQDGGNDPSGEA